jgi:putative ABC transport system permease protein
MIVIVVVIAALAVVVVRVVGGGGSGGLGPGGHKRPDGSTQSPGGTFGDQQQAEFAQCMRDQGIDFRSEVGADGKVEMSPGPGVDVNGPKGRPDRLRRGSVGRSVAPMSGLLTVKLRRDLRASWSRFALMVTAIAVSLAVFGGVLFTWGASARETRDAYLSTEPASATILLDQAIGAEQMAAIAAQARQRPGVIAATGRTQFDTEAEVNGTPRVLPLQVFVAAPDDPMRMATFELRPGGWPPSPGEVFIARDSLSLLDMAIGDTVTVETPGGERVRLRVAGTVYDPSLAPAEQEQTGRGYLSTASLPGPGGQAALNQLKIQVADPGQDEPSRDRDAIVTIAGQVGQWLQRDYGLAIREIQVPPPAKHPHQWQADSLLLALLIGGAAALLLSTILVANMLNSLFSQQIPQIGIMKAVGARSGRLGRQYLAMTLLVAAAATLLALGPAILIARTGVDRFTNFLGIEAASLAAPWWTYVVVLAVGLGLPPLTALIPLVKASRTTVRAAIDHRGGGSKPSKASGVLARLSRIRRLDRGLLMALRNTVRRPARFWLSVGLLASAGTVFVAGMSLGDGTEAVTDEQTQRRTWDVDVQLVNPTSMDQMSSLLARVPDIARIEGFNVARTGVAGPGQIPVTRTYPDQGHGGIAVTTVPADATTFTPPTLLDGRWLNPRETGAIVVNQVARKNTLPDLQAGDTVQLSVGGQPTTWRAVGIVEEKGGSSGLYTTPEGLAQATGQPQRVNQLRIVTNTSDEPTRQTIAATANTTLTAAGVEVKSAASITRSEAISEGHLGPIVSIVLAISIAMAVVGGIGLASTMGANILDRTREFGIMHAIGAPPTAVRRIVVAEGIFLAIISCLVAVIPALALTKILGNGLGNLFFSAPLPYRISLLAAGIWVALVILGSILATDVAASRASRITVREALTYL